MKKLIYNPEEAERLRKLEVIDKVGLWVFRALYAVIAVALGWLFILGVANPSNPEVRIPVLVLVGAIAARFASEAFFDWLAADKEYGA